MIRRFDVEGKTTQGSIAIWDGKQGDFKIAEVYTSMFKTEAKAKLVAKLFAAVLEELDNGDLL